MEYWDTSALVKLYVREADSSAYLDLLNSGSDRIATSVISQVELLCTLYRKQQLGDLRLRVARTALRRFASDVESGAILILPCGRDIPALAEGLLASPAKDKDQGIVRSLDLIHVCTAVSAGADIVVTADHRQARVCVVAGLNVAPGQP